MRIGGFIKTSYNDYPGCLSSVIFTNGCNMKCAYCHNGDLAKGTAPLLETDSIIDTLKKRRQFVKAVVVSGGEPTVQTDIISFLRILKDFDLKVKLDTNGLRPEVLSEVLDANLVDYIAMDLKWHPDDYKIFVKSEALAKVAAQNIMASMAMAKASKVTFELRTTILKPYHNAAMLAELYKLSKNADLAAWQQYRAVDTQYEQVAFETYDIETLKNLKDQLEKEVPIVIRSHHQ